MSLATASLVAMLVVPFTALAQPQTYKIDPQKSTLNWKGEKVTGHHTGTVSVQSGQAIVEDGKLVGGEFQVKMTSIKVLDIQDPKYNKKLTDHLFSDDFFSVNSFPTSTFKITKAEPIKEAKDGQPNYKLEGELSIKGVITAISFPATVKINGTSASATASTKVDRTKYNIRYGSGKFFENLGDKLIYDEFSVDLNLVATKA